MDEEMNQPSYTDMELRDIRYRLNVLDHKMDAILARLDRISEELPALKIEIRHERLSAKVTMSVIEQTSVSQSMQIKKMAESIKNIEEFIGNLELHVHEVVYDMHSVPLEALPVEYEPAYEPFEDDGK